MPGLGLAISPAMPLGAPQWVPTNINGCVMWMRGDLGVTEEGTGVSSWLDQSGNGHDLVQATDSARPSLVASSADFNSHPCIDFNGTSDFLLDATATLTAGNLHTMAAVIKSDVADNTNRWLLASATGRIELVWSTAAGGALHAIQHDSGRVDFADSVPDTATQDLMLICSGTGTTGTIYENGTARTPGGAIAASPLAGAFCVGRIAASAAGYFDGKVAEVVVYDSALGAADRDALRAYFTTRYGY